MSHSRFRLVIGLLLGGLIAGASTDASPLAASQADAAKASIQERLNRIRSDLFSRAERIDEDIRELKEILALDPRSAEAHLLLGIAYRTRGSQDLMGEAVAELRQALELNPGFVPARFYLAHIYLDLGRPGRARDELEAALVQNPGNPQFLALLGEAERQLKNPRRAVEVTRQALQADESFAQARYYLGLALFDLGQRDEAITELERVVQSGPKVVEAYLGLGTAYIEARRFDEALQTLGQAALIDPSRADIRIQLSRAYRSKGLLVKADEQLGLATPKGQATLASTYHERQQEDLDFYLEQGLLRLQQGRLEAAATALQKALAIDPTDGRTKLLQETLRSNKKTGSRE